MLNSPEFEFTELNNNHTRVTTRLRLPRKSMSEAERMEIQDRCRQACISPVTVASGGWSGDMQFVGLEAIFNSKEEAHSIETKQLFLQSKKSIEEKVFTLLT